MTALAVVLAVVLGLLGLLAGVLLVQVAAALAGRALMRPSDPPGPHREIVAVIVPAHNESRSMVPTLAAARAQLGPRDRLLVVADNCTDDTADIARSAGAEVVERSDPTRRGKGYALDFGVQYLRAQPPGVVVVLDADCLPSEGALALLAADAHRLQRPVQGLYLMQPPPRSSLRQRVAAFAWVVKNLVRPLGMRTLGLPCQLMGTGMAFPWSALASRSLATGHLVEDMHLGIALALDGLPPHFEPRALVTSDFPVHAEASNSQRLRWERGHLQTLLVDGPRLLWRGMARADARSIALALDLIVPPLSLLFLLIVAACAAGIAISGAFGHTGLLIVAAVPLLTLTAAIVLAWSGFGRSAISMGDLLRAPLYALAKLPMYLRFGLGRKVEWVRTRRRSE